MLKKFVIKARRIQEVELTMFAEDTAEAERKTFASLQEDGGYDVIESYDEIEFMEENDTVVWKPTRHGTGYDQVPDQSERTW